MKKFALATATALTLAMGANVAFAQTSQAPMTLAAGEATKAKESVSDTWITTKVKSDLLTEKGIPGSDIKVETNKGVVSLSSTVAISDSQKATAVAITKKIKGVTAVSADGLMAGGATKADNIDKTSAFNPDYPVIRFAEIYYMLAECKYRSGYKKEAANLFNEVRKRNFENKADPDPVTETNIDKYRILDEWMVEFLGEQAAFPLGWVHDVVWARSPAPSPTLSVHAYSPPLTAMSYYDVTARGTLRRKRTELTEHPEG